MRAEQLKNKQSTNKNDFAYVVTPYYGRIARPGHGFENLYIFACVNRNNGTVEKTWVETWCGRTADDLSNWLAQRNVEGLFADGFSLALEKELFQVNIWTRWNVSGDISELTAKHWADLQVA